MGQVEADGGGLHVECSELANEIRKLLAGVVDQQKKGALHGGQARDLTPDARCGTGDHDRGMRILRFPRGDAWRDVGIHTAFLIHERAQIGSAWMLRRLRKFTGTEIQWCRRLPRRATSE